MANKLSPVQIAKLKKIMSDPVLWAETFLVSYNALTKKKGPWKARPYQEEMMRDTSLYKVYRCGRRLGKSETMVVEAIYKAFTHENFRVLFVTPYENQVSNIFRRIRELVSDSPLVKSQVTSMKNSPYTVEFNNKSVILGFTSGASSGSNAASVRGQRADAIFLDELDYMGDGDYSTIAAIAGERADISITVSSTPTGKRGTFYQMCNDPKMGYSEHYHPSMDNPGWNQEMEDKFRATLSPSQYDHEILAIFGTEETGVFNKDKLDKARHMEYYAYDKLSDMQQRKIDNNMPEMLLYDYDNPAPPNVFRTVGVDWDMSQASSSIIVLDYDVNTKHFRVMKRIEVPRSEYTIDNAVNWVVGVNSIYNPSWIFCDRGYGDYQIERLHIYGDQHPSSGLKNKVVGWQFKNTIDIIDPVTQVMTKEPMKPFMVNQLVIAFDRGRISLSPFDDVLHKQLVDYVIERISQNGQPIYTSKNEHFVDALGLAYLAFVLKFPDITRAIKVPKNSTKIEHSSVMLGMRKAGQALRSLDKPIVNPWKDRVEQNQILRAEEPKEAGQNWVHVPVERQLPVAHISTWGSRGGFGQSVRSIW